MPTDEQLEHILAREDRRALDAMKLEHVEQLQRRTLGEALANRDLQADVQSVFDTIVNVVDFAKEFEPLATAEIIASNVLQRAGYNVNRHGGLTPRH